MKENRVLETALRIGWIAKQAIGLIIKCNHKPASDDPSHAFDETGQLLKPDD